MRVRLSGWIYTFDKTLTAWIQGWGEAWRPFMYFITEFGEPRYYALITMLLIAWTGFLRRFNLTLAFIGVIIGMGIISVLKAVTGRTRPDTLYVATEKPGGLSFPSGHAGTAMLFYGLLAYLAFKYLPAPYNLVTAAVAGLLIFFIGVSRVYLGAHYPTDVIGGWILGAIVLLFIIALAKP